MVEKSVKKENKWFKKAFIVIGVIAMVKSKVEIGVIVINIIVKLVVEEKFVIDYIIKKLFHK